MTGKLFRIFFISLLLTVNTFIYFIFFQVNIPKHLAYIPDNAMMVFSINTKEISGKLAYSALFNEKDFSELIDSDKESGIDWSENINNGLNFFGRITMLFLPNPDSIIPISCMMVDVSSEKQLHSFLKKQNAEFENPETGITYSVTESGVIMFNEEIALIFNGVENHEQWRKSGLDVLNKKFATGNQKGIEQYYDKDFIISTKPGIEKMTDAPALKGIMGSFIQKLILSGDFQDTFVAMNYELVTDSTLLSDASKVFEKHEFSSTIPDELKQGIFNFHMTFNPEQWIDWMQKGNYLAIPDSISNDVYTGLQQSLGQQFVLQVDEIRLIKIDFDSTKNGMKTFPLPDFKASFTLKDNEIVQMLFEQMTSKGILTKENAQYQFKSQFDIKYNFKIEENVLAISTTDDFILDPQNHFYGFSNWFYFNAENYIEAIPADNPIGYTVKEVMHMVNSINYGYGYSTGTDKNRVLWEGNMYYTEMKKHSLIETIKFMHKMSGLFVL